MRVTPPFCLGLIAMMLLTAPPAAAQDPPPASLKGEILSRVFLDPTTYAPAGIAFVGHHLDWSSSQVFFEHGFVEGNPDFTLSGELNDIPISSGAGYRKIVVGVLSTFGVSVANNAASALVERLAIARFPEHRKLVRALGWIERILVATCWSYRESAHHYRQWRSNQQLARQLGF